MFSENLGPLSSLPSSEHLTARKATKQKFIETEDKQSEERKLFLSESLAIYKSIIHEICNVPQEQKIYDLLESEHTLLEEYQRSLHIEKYDALFKEDDLKKKAYKAEESEEQTLHNFESHLSKLREEAYSKETQIEELENTIEEASTHIEKLEKRKEELLTSRNEKNLLASKDKILEDMIFSFQRSYRNLSENLELLLTRMNELDFYYRKSNECLKEKEECPYDVGDCVLPRKDVTFDEFWVETDESVILSSLSEDFFPLEDIPDHMNKLEEFLKKRLKKQSKYEIKIEGIIHEISSAKILKEQLKEDNKNLRKMMNKADRLEAKLQNELMEVDEKGHMRKIYEDVKEEGEMELENRDVETVMI